MSAPRGPRDPSLEASYSEISAAAERARQRLHEELEELRAGIETMLAEEASGESKLALLGDGLVERARSTSTALLGSSALFGLITAICLAIPATVALHEGLPLIEGSSIPVPPTEHGSEAIAAKGRAARNLVPGRLGLVPASQSGSFLTNAGSGLVPSPRFAVRALVPVRSSTNQSPIHGAPGPGHHAPAPPAPVPSPETTQFVPSAQTTQFTSPPPAGSQANGSANSDTSKSGGEGDGNGNGPGGPAVSAASRGKGHGSQGKGHGSQGKGHGSQGGSHGSQGEGHGSARSDRGGHGGSGSHSNSQGSQGEDRASSPPPSPAPSGNPVSAESGKPDSAPHGNGENPGQHGNAESAGSGPGRSESPGHSGK